MRSFLKKIDAFLHGFFALGDDPLAAPLRGDRSIEYSFVVRHLLQENRSQSVLDLGACESPLTTIIAVLGFSRVSAIDLMPSPVDFKDFPNLDYIQADFTKAETRKLLLPQYNIVSICSSIEHFGLKRYGSPEMPNADIDALKIVEELLAPGGKLIVTLPYGIEKTIAPFHMVYNEGGPLIKYLFQNFTAEVEQYYRNNEKNLWVPCSEKEAASVMPSANNYALGLFVFRKK